MKKQTPRSREGTYGSHMTGVGGMGKMMNGMKKYRLLVIKIAQGCEYSTGNIVQKILMVTTKRIDAKPNFQSRKGKGRTKVF